MSPKNEIYIFIGVGGGGIMFIKSFEIKYFKFVFYRVLSSENWEFQFRPLVSLQVSSTDYKRKFKPLDIIKISITIINCYYTAIIYDEKG